ncbi:MAG TPA: cytochrome c oxidase subunit II [Microbacteriaceae bacterium]|nr:cytochrome c oxidase subunit II [Microbacteriaceae bacterium]
MRHKRRSRWAVLPLAALLTAVLAGCTQAQLHGFLPGFVKGEKPVTTNTPLVDGLWVTAWIVLLIVGFTVWGLIIWTLVVYRRRKGQTGLPVQMQYNMPIEIFYTVVPLILIFGFFSFTAHDQNIIEQRYQHPDQTIEVIAKQWSWDFNYKTENVYSPGIQAQPAPGGPQGSVVESKLPTLYLPVNKKVEILLTSRDVIHSFWVPAFLYKKDMFPDRINYMSVTPERIGEYAGKCAELCGEYHSQMLFNVKIVSDKVFMQHMNQLKSEGYSGQLSDSYDRNQNLNGTGAPRENTPSK